MANATPEAKLEYILTVLRHAELPRPNFNAIAAETGQSSANNAQKKFKAMIESAGFKLENSQIIDPKSKGHQSTTNGTSTPKGRKGASAKSTPTRKPAAKAKVSPKKRKAEEITPSDDDSDIKEVTKDVVEEELGVKKEPDVKAEDEVEIIVEGTAGNPRARSATIRASPMTTDEED